MVGEVGLGTSVVGRVGKRRAQSAKRDLQCVKSAQPRTKHTNY